VQSEGCPLHRGVSFRRGPTRRTLEARLARSPHHRPRTRLDIAPLKDDAHGPLDSLVGIPSVRAVSGLRGAPCAVVHPEVVTAASGSPLRTWPH
jgi:hypothetical protein